MRVVPVSSVATAASKETKAYAVAIPSVNDATEDDDQSSSFYCSLSNASETTSTTSERPKRRGCNRLLYAYPRMCFVLVLLGCSFGTGAYSAYHLALWTLELAGVRQALAVARTQLVAIEITLRKATTCAVNQIPARAMVVRSNIEEGIKPWRAKVDAYDALFQAGQTNFTKCAATELARFERIVAPRNASTTSPQQECFIAGLEQTITRYELQTPSFARNHVLRRVKQILWNANAERTLEKMKLARHNDTLKLQSSIANASNAIVHVVDVWVEELDKFVTQELETFGIADIRLPEMPVSNSLETFLGMTQVTAGVKQNPLAFVSGEQVMTALRGIARSDHNLGRALDVFEKAFAEIISVVKSLDQYETKVRQELSEIQNATLIHARESIGQFKNATMKLKTAVAAQVRASIDATIAATSNLIQVDPSNELEQILKRVFGNDNDLIPSDVRMDPHQQPSIEVVKLEPAFDSLGRVMRQTPTVDQDAYRDPWLFRASLYDASAILVTIVLTWDFLSRLGWFLGMLARLLTESYSDLPPVDIRDITSITTLIDFWGVLKCRHDLGSVVYALLNEGSYVMETAVDFVLWVLLEIAGTYALMAWNEAISDRCRPKNGHLDINATTPSTVMTYLIMWISDSSDKLSTPATTVKKHTSLIDKALDEDDRAWRKRVHSVAQTQSSQMTDLLLERSFLLDVDENLASCSITEAGIDDFALETPQCSLNLLQNIEAVSGWESDAANAFHHHRLQANFTAEALIAECLAHDRPSSTPSLQTSRRLDHGHGCLVDQTLYLAMASWWMVLVIMLALRLTARMLVKAAGMLFWRYLSADRLEILAFSDENGSIQATDRLPKAIRRHLRNIRWRVTARLLGVALGFSSVVIIGLRVLPYTAMQPLV